MECSVFRSHTSVPCSAILQIVTIAVLHKVFPLRSHFCRRMHEVVFGSKVVLVVGLVYLPDIVQKAFERLFIAILIEQRRGCFIQFVEDNCNKKALCRSKTPLWVKVNCFLIHTMKSYLILFESPVSCVLRSHCIIRKVRIWYSLIYLKIDLGN